MQFDEPVFQLGERLDKWLEENLATLSGDDKMAQGEALADGIEFVKELDRITGTALAALSTLVGLQDWPSEEQRVASLVQGFVIASKYADALHDVLLDVNMQKKFVVQMNAIGDALDSIGSGHRTALVPLLEHRDPGVRAAAGAYLLKLMPERVLPVLRQVEESEHANSAHYTAYWARRGWELDGK